MPKAVEFANLKNLFPNTSWLLGFLPTQVCDIQRCRAWLPAWFRLPVLPARHRQPAWMQKHQRRGIWICLEARRQPVSPWTEDGWAFVWVTGIVNKTRLNSCYCVEMQWAIASIYVPQIINLIINLNSMFAAFSYSLMLGNIVVVLGLYWIMKAASPPLFFFPPLIPEPLPGKNQALRLVWFGFWGAASPALGWWAELLWWEKPQPLHLHVR